MQTARRNSLVLTTTIDPSCVNKMAGTVDLLLLPMLFAFVKHLKDVNFETSQMVAVNDGHYYLDNDTYSLIPFWDNHVQVVARMQGLIGYDTGSILSQMHHEYSLVLKDLSELFVADEEANAENAEHTKYQERA